MSDIVGGVRLVTGTAAAHQAARAWRTRAERAIWRPMLKNGRPLGIVLTCRRGPFPRSTHRTSLNEVRVLLAFTPTFEKIGIDYRVLDSLEAADPDLTMPVNINWEEVAITIADRRYAPEYDSDTQRVVKDYGLVIRCQTRSTCGVPPRPS